MSWWNRPERKDLLVKTCGYPDEWPPRVHVFVDDEGEIEVQSGGDTIWWYSLWEFDALIRDHATEWLAERRIMFCLFDPEIRWWQPLRYDDEGDTVNMGKYNSRDEAIESALRWVADRKEAKP